MAGLLDEILGSLAGDDGDIAGTLGGVLGGDVDGAKAQQATTLGLESILGGLARNAQDPDGAAAILDAINRDHDGAALDDVPAALNDPARAADGEKILGHVFGDEKDAVVQNLASKSGLDLGSIAKLLPMLAPLVMGMLGKRNASGSGFDAGGLSDILGGEAAGFDIGDILGGLSGGSGGGILGKLKDLLGGR